MDLHAALSRVFRRSYAAKLFLVAFIGTHVPLLALVLWMLLRPGEHDPMLTRAAVIALLATLVGTAATLYALHRLLHPVRAAAEAIDAYERVQSIPDLPEHGDDEASRLMRGINRNIRRIEENMRALQDVAVRDSLTQAYNRRGSEQALADSVARAQAQGTPFCLVVADMDDLKQINDAFGHAAGDLALVELVDAARASLREDEWISRWGGDEFLIGLHDDPEGAYRRVAAWQQALAGSQRPLHASVGMANLQPGLSAHYLYRVADAAMYRAKHGGGRRIVRAEG